MKDCWIVEGYDWIPVRHRLRQKWFSDERGEHFGPGCWSFGPMIMAGQAFG